MDQFYQLFLNIKKIIYVLLDKKVVETWPYEDFGKQYLTKIQKNI